MVGAEKKRVAADEGKKTFFSLALASDSILSL